MAGQEGGGHLAGPDGATPLGSVPSFPPPAALACAAGPRLRGGVRLPAALQVAAPTHVPGLDLPAPSQTAHPPPAPKSQLERGSRAQGPRACSPSAARLGVKPRREAQALPSPGCASPAVHTAHATGPMPGSTLHSSRLTLADPPHRSARVPLLPRRFPQGLWPPRPHPRGSSVTIPPERSQLPFWGLGLGQSRDFLGGGSGLGKLFPLPPLDSWPPPNRGRECTLLSCSSGLFRVSEETPHAALQGGVWKQA